jgi:hypothetical protein
LRFKVLTAAKMSVLVFWVVSRVDLYIVSKVSEESVTYDFTLKMEAVLSRT